MPFVLESSQQTKRQNQAGEKNYKTKFVSLSFKVLEMCLSGVRINIRCKPLPQIYGKKPNHENAKGAKGNFINQLNVKSEVLRQFDED